MMTIKTAYTRSSQEINLAIARWRRESDLEAIDRQGFPFLSLDVQNDWLAKARTARQVSRGQLAKKLQISYDGVLKLENSEKDGSLSLRRMREYAAALDCELIYGLSLNTRKPFSQEIAQAILVKALNYSAPKFSWTRVNDLAAKMNELFRDPVFRKKQNWGRNPAGHGSVGRLLRRVRVKQVTMRGLGLPKI